MLSPLPVSPLAPHDQLLPPPHRSIGVLTYVMLTGESPFLGDTKQETFLNISQVNVEYPSDVFEGISDLAIEFIQSLLIKNPRYLLLPPHLPQWPRACGVPGQKLPAEPSSCGGLRQGNCPDLDLR